MLTREEILIAALAAWRFRATGRLPSVVVCEFRGQAPLTASGAESREALQAWEEIAALLEVSPTTYMGLLLGNPEAVAQALLRTLSHTPETVGWVNDLDSARPSKA
jgi:hypothetical protein